MTSRSLTILLFCKIRFSTLRTDTYSMRSTTQTRSTNLKTNTHRCSAMLKWCPMWHGSVMELQQRNSNPLNISILVVDWTQTHRHLSLATLFWSFLIIQRQRMIKHSTAWILLLLWNVLIKTKHLIARLKQLVLLANLFLKWWGIHQKIRIQPYLKSAITL